ncbi:hypothetical protein GKQ23_05365 [Erwinia sp. E602]|uniref:protein YgfX n=1 Tax=Erwinia sp. E602 TaxID=2675378 RepID=UPI001BA60BB8|nr:protein YgfX [Erwinia sp. E602]QUG74468.1 hypothetical protein GKQ23_05365 [Erwinia sp. E602]
MARWQSELRLSRCACRLSLLLHGAVLMSLLLAHWPASVTPWWGVLLALTLLESVRSQRRIRRRTGYLSWSLGRQLRWREQRWHLQRPPWLTPWAILLTLRNARGKRERLWLFADAMPPAAWRLLRQRLLMPEGDV